ncbi:MAG: efflux RND transporter periplasmic adaptor subunit [bacterium]
MKKALASLVFLAVAGTLGWQIYRKVSTAQSPGRGGGDRPAVAVEVARVGRARIENIERFTGTLQARSGFHVAAKVGGTLEKLLVDVSDTVRRGQLVAVLDAAEPTRELEEAQAALEVARANAEEIRLAAALDDEELAQKVAQCEAELGIARANVAETRSALAVAEREFERAKTLRGKTILSQSELDAAEARYKAAAARQEVALAQVAEKEAALKAAQVRLSETQKKARAAELKLAQAQVARSEAALEAAQVRLSYTRIKATWDDGAEERVIGERFVDVGTMLKPNEPIVSVLDIDVLKAVVHVTERDYSKVRPGQEVSVTTDAVAGRTFTGRIVRVAPLLKEASRQARVEIEVPNPQRLLKPGMFIRAEINLGTHENAAVVPRSAIVRRNGRRGVFLADREELRAHFVPVSPGIVEGDLAELVDPPKRLEGAWVVTLGHHLLEDGSAITLPEEAAASPEPPTPWAEKGER